ncbi:geranylgeranylglycerol-phosphate geranylgeranyltransferase [candidate division KSB1 bacterium]
MYYLILARWFNVFITFLVVVLGGVYSGIVIPGKNIFIAAVSASFISAGGNAVNDYFDYEIDRLNKSFRPLPSGKITRENALIFWFSVNLTGLVLSLFINSSAFLIALFAVVFLYIYSSHEKNRILTGNLLVSILSGMAFLYSGVAAGSLYGVIIPAVFAFLFHFGREIIKDMQDMDADSAGNAITFPVKYGKNNAVILTGIAFFVLILFTLIPYLYLDYSKTYLLIVLFGVDIVLMVVYILLILNKTETNLRRLSAVLKADIFIGLTALLFK